MANATQKKATEKAADSDPIEEKASITDWGVKDTNAKEVPRVHEPIMGKRYSLRSDEFTMMPEYHARKFLVDPAFIVIDESGKRVPPLGDSQKLRPGSDIPALAEDQTVASFDELTTEALLARASQRQGGEHLSSKSARSEVIAFLLNTPVGRRAARETDPDEDFDAGAIETMSDDDAGDILQGE